MPYCPALSGDTPEARLNQVEAHARTRVTTVSRYLTFDDNKWNVTAYVSRRKGVPARKGKMHLCFHHLSQRTVSFGKSYVLLNHKLGYDAVRNRIVALGFLDAAMSSDGIEKISDLNAGTFDRAMMLVRRKHSEEKADVYGGHLEGIARFLAVKRLARPTVAEWRRPARDRDNEPVRSSAVSQERRERKLPTIDAMEAITRAFRLASAPADVVVVCVTAIASAAPVRPNEELAIPENPRVPLIGPGGTPMLGLKWQGSKGHGESVKPVATDMVPVVEEAVARLEKVTAGGRAIKRWYDNPRNDGRLFLPPKLEELRGRGRLTPNELASVIGIRPAGLCAYVLRNGLADQPKQFARQGLTSRVSFTSVQAHLLSVLPEMMQDAGGRKSHPLLLVEYGTFRRRLSSPCPCMFETVDAHHLWRALGNSPLYRSIFNRLGLDPGSTIRLNLYALRHWLNHLLRIGGASEGDIAASSARADERHNAAYDHSSADQSRHTLCEIKRPFDDDGAAA